MKPIYVSFHIGRGGHFNNPGFLTFEREENFQELLHRLNERLIFVNTDEDGNVLPDDDWRILDNAGDELVETREDIESLEGGLDFDGDYDSYIVSELSEVCGLEDHYIDKVWDAYINGAEMSDDLKDWLCSHKDYLSTHGEGLHRAKDIKRIGSTIQITTQKEGDNHTINIDIDHQAGVFTRKEWKEDLEDMDFCPVSVEAILDYMDNFCDTNDTSFFAEDEEAE